MTIRRDPDVTASKMFDAAHAKLGCWQCVYARMHDLGERPCCSHPTGSRDLVVSRNNGSCLRRQPVVFPRVEVAHGSAE